MHDHLDLREPLSNNLMLFLINIFMNEPCIDPKMEGAPKLAPKKSFL